MSTDSLSSDTSAHLGATKVSRRAGWLAMAVSATVLFGWAIGSDRLVSIDLRFIAMLPNTAVGIFAAGVALVLLRSPSVPGRVPWVLALAVFVFTLGLVSFASRLAGRELLHVGALFRERVALYPYRPVGLIATNSTLVLMMTGMALFLSTGASNQGRRAARILATASLTITTVALLGHLYGARALFTVDRFAGMALITAFAFSAIQVGILFLRPEEGAISLVARRDLASRLMRRLMPLTVLVPIGMGVLWIEGREESLFSRETGVALFVVFSSAWLLGVLLYNARFIRRAEEARDRLLEREQQLRVAAETANKAKSDFLAVMSHELRTPLNAIVGYVDLLESGVTGAVTAEQAKHLGRIRGSAAHLTRTVSDILTLTRLDAGTGIGPMERVDVRGVLDEVAGILEPLARVKKLAFEVRCEASLSVSADPHRLRQILINLGGNAIKFTVSGGIAVRATGEGDLVRIAVTDTGIGIAAADLERIFDEFWQVEGALTRTFDGAGLGLAVSRRLARQLKGDITVVSAPGEGSTFLLTLPRIHASSSISGVEKEPVAETELPNSPNPT